MGQNYHLNNKGINHLQINGNIELDSLKSINDHPKRNSISLWFDEIYKYYYIPEENKYADSFKIEEIFISTKDNKKISGITIFIDGNFDLVLNNLKIILGNALLKNQASIQSNDVRTKYFWKTPDDVTIFLTKYQSEQLIKLDFFISDVNDTSPGLTFRSN